MWRFRQADFSRLGLRYDHLKESGALPQRENPDNSYRFANVRLVP